MDNLSLEVVYYSDLPWCKTKLTRRKLEGCPVGFDCSAVGPQDPTGSRHLGQKSAMVCQEQGLFLTSVTSPHHQVGCKLVKKLTRCGGWGTKSLSTGQQVKTADKLAGKQKSMEQSGKHCL